MKQILDNYLQKAPQVRHSKIEEKQTAEVEEGEKNELEYVQMTAFVICQDLKNNEEEKDLKYQVKV